MPVKQRNGKIFFAGDLYNAAKISPVIHPSSTRATIHTIKVPNGLMLKSAAAKAELPVTAI